MTAPYLWHKTRGHHIARRMDDDAPPSAADALVLYFDPATGSVV